MSEQRTGTAITSFSEIDELLFEAKGRAQDNFDRRHGTMCAAQHALGIVCWFWTRED